MSYGIKNFITENKGIIKLLAGFVFPQDIKVLNLSEEDLKKKFIEIIEDDFFPKEIDKKHEDIEHLKLFAWLLYNQRIY